jgi:hypothetical protein
VEAEAYIAIIRIFTPKYQYLDQSASDICRKSPTPFDRDHRFNDPDSEKTLEDQTSKAQTNLAQVKRVTPGHTARDCAFFFTQTSLV